ncbi:MAG: zinc-dependent alcohol dehydrogenase family protein [Propionicimonas sp.]
MRAIVYDAVGATPVLTDVPEPDCPDDGAVIAVKATGICRSDWHAWRGHDPVPLPNIPGHEFAGVVARVGNRVTAFAVGDRVTVPFVNGCGRCEWCRTGQAQVCPHQTQPGFTHPGSFAEQVAVRAADFNLVRLPADIDFVTAAALGCRFATAYHALIAQGQLRSGEWLAVLGCGGVGLSAVMVGVALGARVVAVDPSPAARQRATELGAFVVLGEATAEAIIEATGGGAHVCVDALGSASTATAGILGLRRRGRHVQVGLMLAESATTPLPWGAIVSRELEVVGSHGMAAADYPGLLAMISSGQLAPRTLVGRTVGLDQAGVELMAMDAPVPSAAGLVVAVIGP